MGLKGTIVRRFQTRATINATQKALASGYKKAAKFLQKDLKVSVSTPYPPASSPGKPPHQRTGKLKNSITVTGTKDGLTIRSVNYGLFLNEGTGTILPRPWVNKGITRNRAAITKIVKAEVKRLVTQKARRKKRPSIGDAMALVGVAHGNQGGITIPDVTPQYDNMLAEIFRWTMRFESEELDSTVVPCGPYDCKRWIFSNDR